MTKNTLPSLTEFFVSQLFSTATAHEKIGTRCEFLLTDNAVEGIPVTITNVISPAYSIYGVVTDWGDKFIVHEREIKIKKIGFSPLNVKEKP